ncbi:hypothetical protein [Nocardia wallacei]|uniref:hypothetical protein n=1 Tax=Nocardia wallacei TaxID=480035 RepID=UPI002454A68A|nr:hypothetical protein [Nocardia wallacei]
MSVVQSLGVLAMIMLSAIGVLRVVPVCGRWIEALDVYLLVPDSKYFAPVPNRSDYHLLRRCTSPAGHTGAWTTVESSVKRSYRPSMVDPHRRIRKAMVDAGSHAIVLDRELGEAELSRLRIAISLSTTYLLLLGAACRSVDGTVVQFCLLATRDDPIDDGSVLLLSDRHPHEQ